MDSQDSSVQLTREESLEAQLLETQRDTVHLRAQSDLKAIGQQMEALAARIDARLGVNIADYRIDYATGVAKPAVSQSMPEGGMVTTQKAS